jgi:hypothetical protein
MYKSSSCPVPLWRKRRKNPRASVPSPLRGEGGTKNLLSQPPTDRGQSLLKKKRQIVFLLPARFSTGGNPIRLGTKLVIREP